MALHNHASGGSHVPGGRVAAHVVIGVLAVVTLVGCTTTAQGPGTTPAPIGAGPSSPAVPQEAPSTPAEPVADTPVAPAAPPVAPPHGAGNVTESVPVQEQEQLPEARPESTVEVGRGLALAIKLSRAEVQSRIPGEIGGPAVQVDLTADNRGGEPVDVSTVVVTVDDANGNPLSPLYNTPYAPLRDALNPGTSAVGTYVFTLGDAVTKPLRIRVSSAAGQPVAVFVGDLS